MAQRVTDFTPRPVRRPERPRKTFAFPADPQTPAQPVPPPVVQPVVNRQKKQRELRIRLPHINHKSYKLLIGAAAVVVIVAGAAIFILSKHQSDPLPANIKREANLTLYYPKSVPNGFHFDEAAYDPSTNVVTYDYTTSDGNKLYFSLQPKPSNFNFDNFNKKQLSGAHQTQTPIGTATIGVLQQETVSSVVTSKTWVLISAGEKISLDQLDQVSKSLAPVAK